MGYCIEVAFFCGFNDLNNKLYIEQKINLRSSNQKKIKLKLVEGITATRVCEDKFKELKLKKKKNN